MKVQTHQRVLWGLASEKVPKPCYEANSTKINSSTARKTYTNSPRSSPRRRPSATDFILNSAETDEEGKSMNLAPTARRSTRQRQPPEDYHCNGLMVTAIAILIGVIGMLNTMVMSVLERTQEIGILRAVGWLRSRIVRMVLGEAVVQRWPRRSLFGSIVAIA